ncbi:hypothetical protein SAMN05216360_101537 [Methylobacterium phyllostachyos]|uniref:Helix-turn-helix domain-containing protein n=1 Tax=Methylobacterium phyllostachyos TaxID=582672 RepID=A0A1G9S8G8_9HYPH|nr:hypothetical protein [Methylobacterium phyllostachyos]SDM31768.1 hypothetical protein SAMN05216360_101537 [Methylobacterium phyllostachyos]
MSASLTEEEVVDRLRAACVEAGGQTAWAAAHGLSVPYVNDVVRKRRGPAARILEGLGLVREVRYVPRQPETVTLYDRDGLTLIEAEVL